MSSSVTDTLKSIRNKIQWLRYSNKYINDPYVEGLIFKLESIEREINYGVKCEKDS